MHAIRLLSWALAAAPLLFLAACGEDAPAPAPTGAEGLPTETAVVTAPPPAPLAPPEDPTPRLFVQIGRGGHLDATFGRWMGTGTLVASGAAGDDGAATSALQDALRSGLGEVLSSQQGSLPVLQIQALPETPWVHIAAVISVAAEPEIGLSQLDLRLPWDVAPKSVELFSAEEKGPSLRIVFTAQRAGEVVVKWHVRVGETSSLPLHAAFDDASRKKDVESIKALRKLLKETADSWKTETRRVEITLPAEPSPSYVNVLTIVRICGEQGFGHVRFLKKGE